MAIDTTLEFLLVTPGDFVLVGEKLTPLDGSHEEWWIAQVIHIIGGARNPSSNSIFQVMDIDTGYVRCINADMVKRILKYT